MTYYLPKRTLFLWQIRFFAGDVLLLFALSWFAVPLKILLIITAVLLSVTAVISLLYLPRLHRSFSLTVNEDSLQIKFGVIIQTQRIMPKKRMVYAEQHRTPLMVSMSLSVLSLRAARGAVTTPELDKSDSSKILESLI